MEIVAAVDSGEDEEGPQSPGEEPSATGSREPAEDDAYWDTLKTWQWSEDEGEPADRSEHRERPGQRRTQWRSAVLWRRWSRTIRRPGALGRTGPTATRGLAPSPVRRPIGRSARRARKAGLKVAETNVGKNVRRVDDRNHLRTVPVGHSPHPNVRRDRSLRKLTTSVPD